MTIERRNKIITRAIHFIISNPSSDGFDIAKDIATELETLKEYHDRTDMKSMLIDFLLYLNDNGFINNYDFLYIDAVKKYIKEKE